MSGNDLIQKIGVSTVSYSDAIQKVVEEVNKECPVQWFEVLEQRGRVTPKGMVEFQVIVRIGV